MTYEYSCPALLRVQWIPSYHNVTHSRVADVRCGLKVWTGEKWWCFRLSDDPLP